MVVSGHQGKSRGVRRSAHNMAAVTSRCETTRRQQRIVLRCLSPTDGKDGSLMIVMRDFIGMHVATSKALDDDESLRWRWAILGYQ